MLIVNLQWALFALLALLFAAVLAAVELTRRRERRRAAAAAAEPLRPLLAQAPAGVLMLSDRLAVEYANPYARRVLELKLDAAALPRAGWVQQLAEDAAAAQAAAESEGRPGGRYRTLTLPSQRTVRWWVAPYQGRTVVLLTDVTAQHEAGQSARTLLSDLAHELRTPLATLLTHLEVMGLPGIGPEVRSQSVQFMKDETQRLVRLADNALELGRLEAAAEREPGPVDLVAVAEEAVAQMAPQARATQIDLSLEAEAALPPGRGHADLLKQLLLNLLDNALKYCRPGDRVVVAVRAAETGLLCSVCDTGPGIAPEHRPHVTRRFYRGVPAGIAGSGLGLALAAEILRQHGSRLEVESRTALEAEPGRPPGTCMCFVLPAAGKEGA